MDKIVLTNYEDISDTAEGNVELEEVSESDLEELDYGYSDSESDSESDYTTSSEDEPPRKGYRATKKVNKNNRSR